MQHLICHNCRTPLTIRTGAPARLTCPACLAPINNPHPGPARPPDPADVLATRPPPLPVEDDTARDLARVNQVLLTITLVLAAGAALSALLGHLPTALLLFFAAAGVTALLLRDVRPRTRTRTPLSPQSPHAPGAPPPPTLAYQPPFLPAATAGSGCLAAFLKAAVVAVCILLLLAGLCFALIAVQLGTSGFR